MSRNNPLITITQNKLFGNFEVQIEGHKKGVLHIPVVVLFRLTEESGEGLTKIDKGSLNISIKGLTYAGDSKTISIPLNDIASVQPFYNIIQIYKKGRQKPYMFIWEDNITMKLVGVPGDNGEIKPLSGNIVAQFIIMCKETKIVTNSNKKTPS